jgi:hypothetical protein
LAQALELRDIIGDEDALASQIANKYQEWQSYRNKWLDTVREIREYVFATSTRTTTNASLPWKNSVHIPKLCQIRDNLHANYMAALFPQEYAITWEGDDEDAQAKQKREMIEHYMQNKMRQSKFRTTVSDLLYDFIDFGNVFAMPVFIADYKTDPKTGEKFPTYIGPSLQRISPFDIVFDPTAPSFEASPKIIRTVKNIGSFLSEIEEKPELAYLSEGIEKMKEARRKMSGYAEGDFSKNEAFDIDGFTSWWNYFASSYVEVLDFYGDIYDNETGTLYRDHLITVVDRKFIVRNHSDESWLGCPTIRHCGWRTRPDNLYAMGPLENLVGMQYRIDHLENAKSDAYDLIIHPVIKIKGFCEPFEYGPGAEIYVGDEGDAAFMAPDVTMLSADTQVAQIEAKMEEMAGAPKQAMGFRTPGEKTAYEIQVLENGANRIFLNKTSYFEEIFLEPLLNDMLELARRNLNEQDTIRVLDDASGAVIFQTITKEDISANGKIRPLGARHFAQYATLVQNITQLYNSALGQDPAVQVHLSGKKIAEIMERLLGWERMGIFGDNIRLLEMAETERMKQSVQMMLQSEQQAVDPEGRFSQPTDGKGPPPQAPASQMGIPPGQGAPPPDAGA